MVSAARSRRMRFFFVIQNYAQLSEVYGKEKGDTIRGNCTNIVYLISTELAALKEISEMCGEIKVKTDKKDKDGKAIEETRPLITVSDLQKLKVGEIILLRLRMDPFRTKLKLNWQIDWGEADKCEKATYPTRQKQSVHTFDLKTFVNKKREAKREESMNKLLSQVMPNMNKNGTGLPGMGSSMPSGAPQRPMTMQDMLKNIDKAVEKYEKEEQRKQAGIMGKGTSSDGKIEPVKVPANMANNPAINPLDINNANNNIVNNEVKKNISKEKIEVKNNFNSADFAARITNKVNQTVKEEHNKPNSEIVKSEAKTELAKPKDYVTDDQFFDDFFADDDD